MMSNGMIPTRTFIDQQHGRETVWHAASKATAEILYLLDASTGPSGHDTEDSPPNEAEVAAYKSFRAWFGPQIAAVVQSVAIGPIISSIMFDPKDGGIMLDRGVAMGTGRVCEPTSGKRKTEARALWLITEIQNLQEYYGELYDSEIEKMQADCKLAADFDFVDGEMSAAVEILSELETWHMFAQPGARFMRGDKDAIANSRELLEESQRFVEKMDAERSQLERALKEGGLSSDEEAEHARMRIEEHARKIDELNGRIDALADERKRLAGLIGNYENGANG